MILYEMSGSENEMVGGKAAEIYNSINWDD